MLQGVSKFCTGLREETQSRDLAIRGGSAEGRRGTVTVSKLCRNTTDALVPISICVSRMGDGEGKWCLPVLLFVEMTPNDPCPSSTSWRDQETNLSPIYPRYF